MSRKEAQRRGGLLSVSILSGIGLILAAQVGISSLINAPCFKAREVELVWPRGENHPPERYRLRPALSIFRADLQEIARALSRLKPSEEVDSVRRILPHRIVAVMRAKRPIAQMKADRYYPISEEGRILLEGQPHPWPHLPVLFLDGAQRRYRAGETVSHPGFPAAAELLHRVWRMGPLAGHRANSIRVRGAEAALELDSGLEVRFHGNRLEEGWQRWTQLISQRPELLEQARYIDLRFGDPVIGPAPRSKDRRRS